MVSLLFLLLLYLVFIMWSKNSDLLIQSFASTLQVLESDDEETASDSKDDCVKKKSKKGGDRRKHQRMWTLSEVTNLID